MTFQQQRVKLHNALLGKKTQQAINNLYKIYCRQKVKTMLSLCNIDQLYWIMYCTQNENPKQKTNANAINQTRIHGSICQVYLIFDVVQSKVITPL